MGKIRTMMNGMVERKSFTRETPLGGVAINSFELVKV